MGMRLKSRFRTVLWLTMLALIVQLPISAAAAVLDSSGIDGIAELEPSQFEELPHWLEVDLRGEWVYVSGRGFKGKIIVEEMDGDTFSGSIHIDSSNTEQLADGLLEGSTITFRRLWSSGMEQQYTGQVYINAEGAMQARGSFTGAGGGDSWELIYQGTLDLEGMELPSDDDRAKPTAADDTGTQETAAVGSYNVQAEGISVGARIGWSQQDCLGWRLYRSKTSGTQGLSVSDFYITATDFIDVNVEANTTYYYILRPVLAEADPFADQPERLGAPSAEIRITTPAALSTGGTAAAAPGTKQFILMTLDEPLMSINGVECEIDPGLGTTPIVRNNRTMVPIRAIIEAMSGTISYDAASRRIALQALGVSLGMTLDEVQLTVDGVSRAMDVAPVSIGGRTMLPIRFVGENLGCAVEWLNSSKQIVIVFTNQASAPSGTASTTPVKETKPEGKAEAKPEPQPESKELGANEKETASGQQSISALVEPGRAAQLGDMQELGLVIQLDAESFSEATQLTIEKLPQDQVAAMRPKQEQFLCRPVSVRADSGESLLDSPARLTMKIDGELSPGDADAILVGYYYNQAWELFPPDSVDLARGEVSFSTSHFSSYAVMQLPREQQLKYYARVAAEEDWHRQEQSKQIAEMIGDSAISAISEFFGTGPKASREIFDKVLVGDVGDYYKLLRDEDLEGLKEKLLTESAGYIIKNYVEDPTFAQATFDQWLGGTKALSSMIGHAAEGDVEGAAIELAKFVAGKFPLTSLWYTGGELMLDMLADWEDRELKNAYQMFKNGGSGFGYRQVEAGNFDDLSVQMKGVLRKVEHDAIQRYMRANGYTFETSIPTDIKDKVKLDACQQLYRQFARRRDAEQAIEAKAATHQRLLQYLDDNGLLDVEATNFSRVHGMNETLRMRSILNVAEHILSICDRKLVYDGPSSPGSEQKNELHARNLSDLMWIWYRHHPDRSPFYQELMRLGYYVQPDMDEWNELLAEEDANADDDFVSSGCRACDEIAKGLLSREESYSDPFIVHTCKGGIRSTTLIPTE